MKLYRTAGGRWVPSQAAWVEQMKAEGHAKPGTPDLIDVPINPKAALVDFLNGLTQAAPAAEPSNGAEVTYAHRDDPGGQRYNQLARDPLPDWATDVRPKEAQGTTPTVSRAYTLQELWDKAPVKERMTLAVDAIDSGIEAMDRMVAALKARA